MSSNQQYFTVWLFCFLSVLWVFPVKENKTYKDNVFLVVAVTLCNIWSNRWKKTHTQFFFPCTLSILKSSSNTHCLCIYVCMCVWVYGSRTLCKTSKWWTNQIKSLFEAICTSKWITEEHQLFQSVFSLTNA